MFKVDIDIWRFASFTLTYTAGYFGLEGGEQ